MEKIISLGLICLLLIVGCSTNGQEEESFELVIDDIVDDPLLEFTYPNYSEEGYIQAEPNNETKKIIIIECINSTLVIDKTMLYCEKLTQ